jgi:hypothetical protein
MMEFLTKMKDMPFWTRLRYFWPKNTAIKELMIISE